MMMLSVIQKNREALQSFEQMALEGARGAYSYLKFAKGIWTAGMDDREIDRDDELALDPKSISKGGICWSGGSVLDERFETLASGRTVNLGELPDHGPYANDDDGWKAAVHCKFKSLTTGEEYSFSSTSHGGRKALAGVTKEFVARMKSGESDLVPIVRLSSDGYKHKLYGYVATPLIEIVGWSNEDDLQAGNVDVVEEIAEEAPAPKRRKVAASAISNGSLPS